jgi:hypothetical protein
MDGTAGKQERRRKDRQEEAGEASLQPCARGVKLRKLVGLAVVPGRHSGYDLK